MFSIIQACWQASTGTQDRSPLYQATTCVLQGQLSWGMADNFSFGHQAASRCTPVFGALGSADAGQLQEGSSSSSGGKRQRLEVPGTEGDSASVSSRAAGSRGAGGGAQEGSSESYTMSAGSAQGGSSISAGGSSGGTGDSRGGRSAAAAGQGRKGPRAGDLRMLEERMAQVGMRQAW